MFYIYADGESIFFPLDERFGLLSPKLTLEIGKTGSLDFMIPASNLFYDKLRKLKTNITVELDETEIFRGRIISEERDFNNVRKIYCEGDLSYLLDSVQKGERFFGYTHDLFRSIIHNHNRRVEESKRFVIGNIGIENRQIYISGQSEEIEDLETGKFDYRQITINATTNEWKTSYDYIQNCIIDQCGGYLRTRRVSGVTYIDLMTDFGTSMQSIEFSKNMIDLTEEISAEELFTVLIPLGDDNLTIESVNNGSDEIVDEEAVALYGRIIKTHVFDTVNDATTLLENAKRYLKTNVNIPITLSVKAIDMHLIDSDIKEIRVGDKVRIRSLPHKLVDTLTCTKIELDLENPANNTYTFGNPKQTMTERYRKDIQKTEEAVTGGGSGGGGAGAAAAAEASESKADAWCNILKEQAFASIGASNERIDSMKRTLKTECGIDFDGSTGNINIRSMKKTVDENGKEIANQGSYISLIQEDLESKIELNTTYVKEMGDAHSASITLLANELGSAIKLKADKIDLDSVETTINSKVTNINSKVINLNAEIVKLKTLVADEITAISAEIESLISRYISSNIIQSTVGVYAPFIRASMGMSVDGKSVATQEYVNNAVATMVTTSWIDEKGFATQQWVDNRNKMGGIETGARWITVGGVSARVSLATHTHNYCTVDDVKNLIANATIAWSNISGKPSTYPAASHRHWFSDSTSISLGHTHRFYDADGRYRSTGGMSTNYSKTIGISGYTGYGGG